MTLADRIAVINQGRIEQVGTPMELYHHPANTFVAGFIGAPAMNFLDGNVDDTGAITFAGATIMPAQPVSHRGSATIGVRPESLRLAGTGEADLVARLDHIEPLGAETLLHFDTPLTVRLNDAVPASEGDTLGLLVDRTRIHVFPP